MSRRQITIHKQQPASVPANLDPVEWNINLREWPEGWSVSVTAFAPAAATKMFHLDDEMLKRHCARPEDAVTAARHAIRRQLRTMRGIKR